MSAYDAPARPVVTVPASVSTPHPIPEDRSDFTRDDEATGV